MGNMGNTGNGRRPCELRGKPLGGRGHGRQVGTPWLKGKPLGGRGHGRPVATKRTYRKALRWKGSRETGGDVAGLKESP